MMSRLAFILAAFWAGSLWTICGIVAPSLFAVLEDRRQAGQLAGRFFHIETWIGVAIGGLLLVLSFAGKIAVPRLWVVLAAGLPLASYLILGPLMSQARAAGDMARFGLLHGFSAVLFFGACLSVLVLLWKLSRPAG